MLTFGELRGDPSRMAEVEGYGVLIGAAGTSEVVVQQDRAPEATMIFAHETIEMMRAERAEQVDKLRDQLDEACAVIPVAKKAGSFWDHITVGRASTADIVLDDPAISNVHAHFEVEGDDELLSVQDVGSSNGTFVNRNALQPHTLTRLHSGDCVRFGQTIFYYLKRSMLEELLALER